MAVVDVPTARPASATRADDGFAGFYEQTWRRTFGLASRVANGDAQVALDATQEAYAQLLRRWEEVGSMERGHLEAYAARAAINQVVNYFRAHHRLGPLDDDHDLGRPDPGIAAVLDQEATFKAIRDLIARQPVRRRAVAVLYFLEERTYAEIAQCLGITESTVRTQVERFREVARRRLEGEG